MPKNVFTLLNEADLPIATMSADSLNAVIRNNLLPEEATAVAASLEAKYRDALTAALTDIPEDSSAEEMRAAIHDAVVKTDVIGKTKKLLRETMINELLTALRPLAVNLTDQAIGDGKELDSFPKELDSFLQGMVAGAEAMTLRQLQAEQAKAKAAE